MQGIVPVDNLWILVATALVFVMGFTGLALFYGGLTRTRSMLNSILMVTASFALASVLWLAYGYSLAFEGDIGGVIGTFKQLFLKGYAPSSPSDVAGNLYAYLFAFYQMTFAAITVALIAGAWVERIKFSAWLLFSALWLTLVYIPVAHWIWGGGFLGSLGVRDFAGGLVVHATSGVTALVGAYLIGKRREAVLMPSNLPLVALGTGLLAFGWFGFNGGSALALNETAISAAFVSLIAAFVGAIVWSLLEWFKFGKPTLLGFMTGIIAGFATITPAAGFVDILGGFLIGILGGVACFLAVVWAKSKFGYDDALDVFGVHGVGGIVGTLAIAFFASPAVGGDKGLLYGSANLLIPQLVGTLVVVLYTAVVSFLLLKLTDKLVGLRVSEEVEIEGLDKHLHGEKAYNER
ncbi:MAG TPA: ammonium transporter [Aquifex aeolicus]|uniref:Ammonium transporter n=1 Tax=Aquifex aeolicus TaxID=63363 RepID=A0A9D0YPF8_AQUAO|nr:ammonium transporter [Aquificales bacterium]HIP98478.1 ammonium transporter [Aquifex aeolicus]HIQ25835.1 ammonium transporter [Aquifex aeolicus]